MLRTGVWAAAVLITLSCPVFAGEPVTAYKQTCDVPADLALGLEDYPTAIILHRRVVHSRPHDALAHYHLGFAYGMVGQRSEEIDEYRKAATLGLDNWDLFLNLGLAYADRGELSNAAKALEHAALLDPERAEPHFNLALVYERQNRLSEAIKEIAISRYLAPEDPDVENTNAILCAEVGDPLCARNLWMHLIQAAPDYSPARVNLVILNREVPRAALLGQHPNLSPLIGSR
jgi:Flp pilus assembly protein TadD